MTVPFMDAYVQLLIKTCHKRGVHAMGGMAAQIPIKDNKEANDKAMEGVYADKLREVRAGHDGTWVAHPALASIASEVFNKHMPTPNQLFKRREDVHITGNDLLNMNMPGTVTEEGIRKNLNIGLGYMEGWLKGVGCVPINYLMVSLLIRLCIEYKLMYILHSRRKMPPRQKSAAVNSGNGASTVSRQLKARKSTKPLPRNYSRNKRTSYPRKRPRVTSTISPLSTSLARSPERIMRTS